MSDTLPNDRLLKAARLLSGFFMVLLGVIFVTLAAAIPVILLSQSHVAEHMVAGAPPVAAARRAAIRGGNPDLASASWSLRHDLPDLVGG